MTAILARQYTGVHSRAPEGARLRQLTCLAVLAMAVGVLIIAISYAAGRSHQPIASSLFWAGELLVFAPPAVRLLAADCARREAQLVVAAIAVSTYLIKVSYSPIGFRFPDELQHLRTTTDLLAAHNLSMTNTALPISNSYPGLELATSAVVDLTHLPTFAAGLLVVGLAHLVTACAFYLLFLTLTDSPRIAALSVLIYSANPHYQSFDSMFVYQALALAFLALCLLACARLSMSDEPPLARQWTAVAAVAATATVVTHHISSYVLLLLLALVVFDRWWAGRRRPARRLLGVTALTTAMIALWLAFVAPKTFQYFEPSVEQLTDSLSGLFNKRNSGSPAPQSGTAFDRWGAYVSVVVILAGLLYGLRYGLRRLRRRGLYTPWRLALGLASLSYLIALGIRVGTSDGAELYGRLLSFVFIPLGYVLAEAALYFVRSAPVARSVIAFALLTAILVGGIVSGWPPSWERVPGKYLVDSFEASVEPQGVASAQWAREHLTPNSRFAADTSNYTLLGTIGEQNPVRDVAPLFYSSSVTSAARELVATGDIRYVLSDNRLSTQIPASGTYFPVDPLAYRHTSPIPLSSLRKFDDVAGVSRVYDSGSIVIYDLRGSSYAP